MSHKIPWLVCILLLALFLRLFQLGSAPRGLHADEVSFLINTQSLIETGRDEDGRSWPWQLTSFIDPKPALYSYVQMPFVVLFGATASSSRMPSAVLGVVSLYLVFLFVQKVYSRRLALLVTGLMAISPWHPIVSRATQEVVLSFVFLIAALFAFRYLSELRKLRSKAGLVLVSLFGLLSFLSMTSYHSNKVYLPLVVIAWSALTLKQHKDQFVKFLITVLVLGTAVWASFLGSNTTARFTAVGVTSNLEPQLLLEEQIRQATGQTPLLMLRFFYNKVTFYGFSLFDVYTQHFTADFLFLKGGQPLRYQVSFHGLLYLVESLLLCLGLLALLTRSKYQKLRWPLLSLAVLAPVPAAITFIETPSMIRSFPLILPLLILLGIALTEILSEKQWLKRSLLGVVIGVGYLWGFGFFWHQLLVQEPIHQPWYRNHPYQVIAQEVKARQVEYPKTVVTNDLRPLYAYFVQEGLIDFATLQANPTGRMQEKYSLGNFIFNRGICDFGPHQNGTLYIAEIDCPADGRQLLKTITYGDGLPVYGIWAEASQPIEILQ